MKFRLEHNNINVIDLNKSIDFYKKALGMHEIRRVEPQSGDFILVFLSDEAKTENGRILELTWLKDHLNPYELGDNESHLAFRVDDIKASHKLHSEMNCICFENTSMGIYFISDPDGYWIEILPEVL